MNNNLIVKKSSLITCPHGFSTRIAGVSIGIFESLNLGMNRGDKEENVSKNWELFLKECQINEKAFVCFCHACLCACGGSSAYRQH